MRRAHPPALALARLKAYTAVVLVIDPQVGFCSPEGTLARSYGAADVAPIGEAMVHMAAFLDRLPRGVKVVLVTSFYPLGLHTGGDLTDPLAFLCAPVSNRDCELIAGISPHADWLSVVKSSANVMACQDFRKVLDELSEAGRRDVVVCGATLTTCIREAVLGLSRRPEVQQIVLPLDAIGVRSSSRQSAAGGVSREVLALDEMAAAGAILTTTDRIKWA